MLLVNLFGGPGVGKSTTAAALYSQLTMRGYHAESVGEAAKDIVWDNCTALLGNQVLITGMQYQRLRRLVGKVDIAISDSPLILAYVYGRTLPYIELMKPLIHALETGLPETRVLNVLLMRPTTREYNPEGRVQKTLEAAVENDYRIYAEASPQHYSIETTEPEVAKLVDWVERRYLEFIEEKQ